MPHKTHKRPYNEPMILHRARVKAQQEDLKDYLKGHPIWRSCLMIDTRKGIKVGPPKQKDLKKIPLQGTYVAPRCPMCAKKARKGPNGCKCMKGIKFE
jgi:hypothetical protein